MRQEIIAFVERMEHISTAVWGPRVSAFLKRTHTVGFLADLIAETGKTVEEAVFVFLAAIRYVDCNSRTSDPGANQYDDILQLDERQVSLELFLVRHQPRLWHLCCTRSVQTNLPARCLPVMELLADTCGDRPLKVLEPGCSHGLLGRALMNPGPVLEHCERLFGPDQQRPRHTTRVVDYLGFDHAPTDLPWLLACLPRSTMRSQMLDFMDLVPALGADRVIRASLRDLHTLPQVAEFAAPGGPDAPLLVVLTSFVLYQLPPADRGAARTSIADFTRKNRGIWLDMDAWPRDGYNDYRLDLDGQPRLLLQDDLCGHWNSCMTEHS